MSKVKIPKKVAGVKIPKKVRRKAKKAIRIVENPYMREMAVAALGGLAEARAARMMDRPAEADSPARRSSGRTRNGLDPDRLSEAVRQAAAEGIRSFLDGFQEGLRTAADQRGSDGGADDAPEPVRLDKSGAA